MSRNSLAIETDLSMTHPASRAVHALNNALQIINGITESRSDNAQSHRMDCSDVRRLVEQALPDIAALQQMLDRQEGDLADLREEGVRAAQYIVRLEDAESKRTQEVAALREQVTAATLLTEALYQDTDAELGFASTRHAKVLRLRGVFAGEPPIQHIDTPRLAVAGGK